MNKERLLKMADFVETIPQEQFDMNTWGRKNLCGFVGCAIGWAAYKKLFPGLTAKEEFGRICPVFNERTEIEAIEELFEIHHEEAETLFDIDSYKSNPTPKQTAKRIRDFVKSKETA